MIDDDDDSGEVSKTVGGVTYRLQFDVADGYVYPHIDGHGSRPPVKIFPSGAEATARMELEIFIRSLDLKS
jgi:hypothetical protein